MVFDNLFDTYLHLFKSENHIPQERIPSDIRYLI